MSNRPATYRSELARAAALTRSATTPGHVISAPARQARWDGYLARVDAMGQFEPQERIRRATALRDADLALMRAARKSNRKETKHAKT